MRPRAARPPDLALRQPAPRAQPPETLRSVRRSPVSVALAPELWMGVRVPEQLLEQLAVRAQRFTPRVSLAPPDGLLLEVRGSLHLFDGVEGLLEALARECTGLAVQPAISLAPTPLAALVGARLETPLVFTDRARLVGQLAPVPLEALRWPPDTLARLARMGVRTIGQALRLPRAGFARRFGPEQLAQLDRLTGRSPDLREHFRPRERFRGRCDLSYELESHGGIRAALEPLWVDLGKFLAARQCAVTHLECWLRHRHSPPSRCILRLAAPEANVERLEQLLSERLAALSLPEAVRSCELRSGYPIRGVSISQPLWQPGTHGGDGAVEAAELIDRLRARLGPEAIHGLQTLDDHRPERSSAAASCGASAASCGAPGIQPAVVRTRRPSAMSRVGRDAQNVSRTLRRPLWLLSQPRLLAERDGMPRRRGPLRLCGDVERIETGWWEEGEIGRDYYAAYDAHGVLLWIFRERGGPHRWFLHGFFG